MDEGLYNKKLVCPVCSKEFLTTKVKIRAAKVLSRDTDFCLHYEDLNPLLYEVDVCENCGYAALSEKFSDIYDKERETLLKEIAPRWRRRSYAGERSLDTAIEVFKLALYQLQLRKAKSSELAKLCLRLAWLYRFKNDEREKEFLEHALKFYKDAYEKESFPVENLDEYTCAYMIGELSRRLGKKDEAVRWFSILISSREARQKRTLMTLIQDQLQFLREDRKK